MAYKDKDKQRQASKAAIKRFMQKLEPCTANDTCPICPHNGDCIEYRTGGYGDVDYDGICNDAKYDTRRITA